MHQTKQKIQNGLVLPHSSFLFGFWNESCVNTLLIVINPGINSVLGTPKDFYNNDCKSMLNLASVSTFVISLR